MVQTVKKTYFISDIHLGVPNEKESLKREKLLVQFLNEIEPTIETLYIVGDLFDFWCEYKKSIPKGFVRILGKLADLSDKGIPVVFFTGNHDLWMNGYFESELNIPVHHNPIKVNIANNQFFIGHGDGLGPDDKGYKRLKKIFRNPFCQWLFRKLHPDIGIRIASYFSKRSRYANGEKLETFNGEENEWLFQYASRRLEKEQIDYFIFGHRHLPLDLKVTENSRYVNLGDWLNYNSYAVFDGEKLELKYYKP